jgi:hypothetical protein
MKALRLIARWLALGVYVLCYGLVCTVLFYVTALVVGGMLSENGTIEVSGEPAVNFVLGAVIGAGFAFGCYLAIRARANPLAHYSVIAASTAQALAAVVWGQRYFHEMDRPDLTLGQSLGLGIGATLMFCVAIVAAIAVLGAAFGRLADALSGRKPSLTPESHPPPALRPETPPAAAHRPA